MTPEELEKVEYHADQIAKILHSNTDPATIQSLGAIETVVRQTVLQYVSPKIGVFLSDIPPKRKQADIGP